jgi:hypothetical protein
MGRTEQQLEQASEHVKYEIDMLRATVSFLTVSWSATDRVTRCAYLESFVLHLRNLSEFFYQQKKNHICAADYVSDVDKWKRSRGAKSASLGREIRKANEFVAHLSYERCAKDKDRNWDWGIISAELQRLIGCFLSNLPPGRRALFSGCEEGPAGPTGTSSPPVDRGWTGPPEPPVPEKAKTSE